jgi:hypothetical protein
MAAGITYTPIATQTVSGTSTVQIIFSSIPSTYTDLLIVANGSLTITDNTYIQYNVTGGTAYSGTYLTGSGSASASGRYTNNDRIVTDYTSYPTTTAGAWTALIHIMNYSNTSTFKTTLIRSNNAEIGTSASVHVWRNTSAISTVALQSSGSPRLGNGTTYTLYGIENA